MKKDFRKLSNEIITDYCNTLLYKYYKDEWSIIKRYGFRNYYYISALYKCLLAQQECTPVEYSLIDVVSYCTGSSTTGIVNS